MKISARIGIYLLFILLLGFAACTPVEDSNTASISGRVFFDCNKDGECEDDENGIADMCVRLSGRVFFDCNKDGECEDDENGIADMCVRLYFGSCSAENLLQNHTTNENGDFQFTGLAAGEYCVMTDPELLTCGFAGNNPTTSLSRHVKLEDGMHADLEWFGFGNLSGDSDARQ